METIENKLSKMNQNILALKMKMLMMILVMKLTIINRTQTSFYFQTAKSSEVRVRLSFVQLVT